MNSLRIGDTQVGHVEQAIAVALRGKSEGSCGEPPGRPSCAEITCIVHATETGELNMSNSGYPTLFSVEFRHGNEETVDRGESPMGSPLAQWNQPSGCQAAT